MPERLARYVESEWLSPAAWEAGAYEATPWDRHCKARMAWVAEHGGDRLAEHVRARAGSRRIRAGLPPVEG